jgi:hypothetical protein
VASSRKPAVTLPIALRVIIRKSPLLTKPAAMPDRFSIGNVDASRHGPCVLFLARNEHAAMTNLSPLSGG